MNNKIKTYYVVEDDYNRPGTWGYCELSFTLADALCDVGDYPCRIVRYDGKGPGVVVREWDKEGKRVK